jgi:hypothetical protein
LQHSTTGRDAFCASPKGDRADNIKPRGVVGERIVNQRDLLVARAVGLRNAWRLKRLADISKRAIGATNVDRPGEMEVIHAAVRS